jgi:hypothetical protein
MLGHSALKTTKRYLHEMADHINKMGKKIEKLAEESGEDYRHKGGVRQGGPVSPGPA